MGNSKGDRSRLVRLWIAELKSDLGSEAEIARRLGLSTSSVNRWKTTGGIDLENLINLSRLTQHTLGDMLMAFYGVSPEQLVPTAPVIRTDKIVLTDRVMSGRFRMMLVWDEGLD